MGLHPRAARPGRAFVANGWSFVVLGDIVLGFLLMSFVIYFCEPSGARALLWIIPLFILGNVVGAVYVPLNLRRIRTRRAGTYGEHSVRQAGARHSH